jgi:putative ABC transport system permease protein
MPSLGRDVRYGFRLLRQSPGFAGVALATLALGLGAATAIFSVVDAVLLKSLPFPHADQLLVIFEKNPAQNKWKLPVAGGNFLEWRKQARAFVSMAAYQDVHVNLTQGPDGPIAPEELPAQRISANLMPLLGVQPVVGRLFLAEDDQPGNTFTALLSYRLWQRRFGSDPAIGGKSIRLNDRRYTVAGVLPPGFQVLDSAADIWIPLGLDAADARTAHSRFLTVLARLRAGETLEQASAEMDTLGDRLERADPALNHGWRPSVFRLRDEWVGNARQPLYVLLGAVGFLLLMACVNVANLLLARGNARRREIAVRMAMGAGRGRIVVQLLSESLLLSLASGALGWLLAWGAIRLLARFGPDTIPRLAEARLDWRLFLFALAVSTATGVLFGIAPALQASGARLNTVLVEGGRGRTAARSGRLLRHGLVVTEVALAVLVLIAAGLLIRSFARLRAVDLGFQPSGLLALRLPLAGARNASADRRAAFLQQVEERVGALPGVRATAAIDTLPLSGFGNGTSFAVAGRPAPEEPPIGLMRAVTPGYFRVMGLPLMEGRDFTSADNADAPTVLVVSRSLARRFWPQGGAVGSRLLLDPAARPAEIVGVVGDVKPDRIQDEDWLTLYGPYPQNPYRSMTLVMRSALPAQSVLAAAARAIQQLDGEQPVADASPMDRVVGRAMADARFNALLLSVFAQIAFLLAAVGVYGVVSYDASQRTGEIGIRLALGAQRGDVMRLILTQAALLAALGIAIGLAAAWALTRLMATMLYQVAPTDPVTFVAIPLLLGAVVLIAGYLPSRRAMALDPALALRHE